MLTGRRISWRLACFPCTCEGKESCTVRGKKCVHKLIALFRFSHTDLIQWSPDWPAIFRKSQLGTAYSILCCSLLSSHLILLSCTRQLLQMVLVPKFPLGISCLPWDYGIYDQAWQWSGMKKGGCGAEWKVLHQDSCRIWPMSWSLEAPTLKQRFSTFFSQISVIKDCCHGTGMDRLSHSWPCSKEETSSLAAASWFLHCQLATHLTLTFFLE